MEAIVFILADFLLAPLVALFGFLGNLIVTSFSILFEVILALFARSKRPKARTPATPTEVSSARQSRPKKRRRLPSHALRWLSYISGTLFAIVVVILFVINQYYFDSAARWVMAKVSAKTGIGIEFGSVQGNIFSGTAKFENLHIERRNTGRLDYEFLVDMVAVNLDISSLVIRPITFEALAIDDVDGQMWQTARPNDTAGETSQSAVSTKIKAKRDFSIARLDMSNVDVILNREDRQPVALHLDKVESAPLRSRYAVFDIFFRSNMSGSLDGHDINVTTEETARGRITKWRMDEFPVQLVNHYVDKAPFSWLTDGVIDIHVDDEWALGDKAEIDMDWRLRLKDVTAEMPTDVPLLRRTLAAPIVKYINGKDDDIDLRFKLVLNERQFENTASLESSDVWRAFLDGLAKTIAQRTGEEVGDVKQDVDGMVDDFKNYLDGRRKKRDQTDD